MHTGVNHAAGLDSAAALSAILTLVVADHEVREGGGYRRTERILTRAGLSADQIAAITADDASQVDTTIGDHDTPARPARERSVIDRSRAVLRARRGR